MSTEFIIIFWIVVAVITLIALLIHTAIDWSGTYDFDDLIETFTDSFGWATVLICLTIGGIVFGFIAWNWWAMLIITIVLIIVAVTVAIVIYCRRLSEDEEYKQKLNDEVKEIETNIKCHNCGAKITKRTYLDKYANLKEEYYCQYCGGVFDKKDLKSSPKEPSKTEEYELEDWEEDYFEACDIMNFKPHNRHTMKQVDMKHERLGEMYFNGDYEYEVDSMDTEEALDYAYDFFSDNEDEIEEYFKRYSAEDIKKRYEYYLSSSDEDEED